MGIDPGTTIMGYGILIAEGKEIRLETMGVVKLQSYADHYLKLKRIFERTLSLIETYKPDELAIEAPFFGNNVQSMLKLGRAQGVAMAACLYRDIPIFEYSPKSIKMSITGNGNATKEQVANFLKSMFKIQEMPKYADATDGLAAAVCHFYQKSLPSGGKNYKGWGDFVDKNKDRIV
ncbi:MAG: hypothetical protein RIS47_270 [Bacteroidota bacterium]|jgi:crossover junction endodeoxyribonuclease RuvC